MKLVAVIAAYDEEATIEELARRLVAVLRSRRGWNDWEAIFVVEGTDRTREILERLAHELPHVRVLYGGESPQGLGNAFRRGFEAVSADCDLVVTMDADLNHQPEELPRLVEPLRRDCDVVVGSRFLGGSRVEGTPRWKRLLSGTLNVLMRYLYGLDLRDKTSGYRVYRTAVLRDVPYRSGGFAFLPELLIAAARRGYRIREEPIRFVFRSRGASKMAIVQTSLSYLALLRPSLAWTAGLTLSFLVAGLLLRILSEYPVYNWMANADSLLTGMRAFSVLRGETPVFFSGVRIGAMEPYVAAALFAVLGVSRGVLALVPVLTGCVTLVAMWGFCCELLAPDAVRWALPFAAIPSASFLFWTSMPDGYAALLMFCSLILWTVAAIGRQRGGLPLLAMLGLLAGLGFWHTLQTLGVTVPALAWLAARRRDLLASWRSSTLATAAFLLGAFPWLAFNVRYPLATFQNNFGARPVSGLPLLLDNVGYFFSYSVGEVVTPWDEAFLVLLGEPWALRLHAVLEPAAQLVYGASALLFLAAPLGIGALGRCVRARLGPGTWWLLVAVFAGMAAINVLSEAGTARVTTVRYVLPIYLLAPPLLGATLACTRVWSRPLALLAAVAVVGLNLVSYHWPWSASRVSWRQQATHDQRLLAGLRERGVRAAVGGYWTVYPLNFLSGEELVAVPCTSDHYGYGGRVPRPLDRWAMVSSQPAQLAAWAERMGMPEARIVEAAPGRSFIAVDPAGGDEGPRFAAALASCQAHPIFD